MGAFCWPEGPSLISWIVNTRFMSAAYLLGGLLPLKNTVCLTASSRKNYHKKLLFSKS